MQNEIRQRNQLVWRFVVLPILFLTVALLGGLRVGAEKNNFIFVAPPLVCLILTLLLLILFVRGRLIVLSEWINSDFALLTNAANILTLAALFAASVNVLNSVLPDSGLLFWIFAFFFLWTLWNNLFADFDARKLLRSLAVLFGTAFIFKHLILAAFAAPKIAEQSFWQKLSGLILESLQIPSIAAIAGVNNFAPATGYISFFTVCLYVVGLIGLLPRFIEHSPVEDAPRAVDKIVQAIADLSPHEQQLLQEKFAALQTPQSSVAITAAALESNKKR